MNFQDLTKSEVEQALKKDKKAFLAAKSAEVKFTDTLAHEVTVKKSLTEEEAEANLAKDTLDVTIVCNSAWLCDSHMDVLTSDSLKKAVNQNIPHIADHKQTSTSHVGDVTKVYTKTMQLRELGLEQEGSTTAFMMDSTVRKDYNEDVFKFYANGKINQHSIGLRYKDIDIAINNNTEEYKDEKALWDEFYSKVLNKDTVDEKGFFWVVKEITVHENSCVLFGANSLTPTIAVKGLSTKRDNVTKEKGATMTPLEEAQAKNIQLTAEVATLKAEKITIKATAATEEQARVLGILKAQATFKLDPKVALKSIEAGRTVADATEMFEMVAESMGAKTAIDTTSDATTINEATVIPTEETDFNSLLGKALATEQVDPFKGVG